MPRNPPPVAPAKPPRASEAGRAIDLGSAQRAGPRFFAEQTRGSWFDGQTSAVIEPENKNSAAP